MDQVIFAASGVWNSEIIPLPGQQENYFIRNTVSSSVGDQSRIFTFANSLLLNWLQRESCKFSIVGLMILCGIWWLSRFRARSFVSSDIYFRLNLTTYLLISVVGSGDGVARGFASFWWDINLTLFMWRDLIEYLLLFDATLRNGRTRHAKEIMRLTFLKNKFNGKVITHIRDR